MARVKIEKGKSLVEQGFEDCGVYEYKQKVGYTDWRTKKDKVVDVTKKSKIYKRGDEVLAYDRTPLKDKYQIRAVQAQRDSFFVDEDGNAKYFKNRTRNKARGFLEAMSINTALYKKKNGIKTEKKHSYATQSPNDKRVEYLRKMKEENLDPELLEIASRVLKGKQY